MRFWKMRPNWISRLEIGYRRIETMVQEKSKLISDLDKNIVSVCKLEEWMQSQIFHSRQRLKCKCDFHDARWIRSTNHQRQLFYSVLLRPVHLQRLLRSHQQRDRLLLRIKTHQQRDLASAFTSKPPNDVSIPAISIILAYVRKRRLLEPDFNKNRLVHGTLYHHKLCATKSKSN